MASNPSWCLLVWNTIREAFTLKQWLFFLAAWPVMLEGLEVVSMYLSPIYPHPLLRDMSWNWLNPWATGCPTLGPSTTDFSHDYCFGTNMGHFGGPYSILWYWTMYALALGGKFYPYVNDLTVFFIINATIMWRLRNRFQGYDHLSLVNVLYSWTALAFLIAWPQILLTLFATAASLLTNRKLLRAGLLVLGPLLRFPFGAPLYVWSFILHFSIHVPSNYPPYAATIIFWLLSSGLFLRDWSRHGPSTMVTPNILPPINSIATRTRLISSSSESG